MQRGWKRPLSLNGTSSSSIFKRANTLSVPLVIHRQFSGLEFLQYADKAEKLKWKSPFNRVPRDWKDNREPVVHNSIYSPHSDIVIPQDPRGTAGYTEGMDPPPPIFPINKANKHPYTYQPEVLSYKNGMMRCLLLNRPMALHSLNLPAVRTLARVLKKWDKQKLTTCGVILASTCGDHLCAGSDFIDIYNAVKSGDKQYARTFFRELNQLMQTINAMEKPILPIMHGYSMGSGAALAFSSSSFRIATDEAIFAMPEVGMGFVPDCGSTYVLAQLPNEIGTYLLLSGKRMRGWDLLHSGIATHVIRNDQMPVLLESLANIERVDIASTQFMDVLYRNTCYPEEHPFLFEKKGYLDIVKRCFNKDSVQEIMDALEYEFEPWAHEVLKTMKENCPLSMAVALKLIRQGKNGTISDSMDAEYRAAVRLVEMPDFAEGVRARLIEKRKPKWSHASAADVTAEEVDRILAPLPKDQELDSVTFCTSYARRMADVDNFINNSYSELCYTTLRNKLMMLTELRMERQVLVTSIATEVRDNIRKGHEEELAEVDAAIKAAEAIDPENPSEEMKALLAEARAHLELLARGKVTIDDWKVKAAELYKRWAEGTRPTPRIKKERRVEQDKEVYGWSKFFKKEGDAASNPKLGERLGDRLAEKLKVAGGATEAGEATPPSPFAPKVGSGSAAAQGKSTPSLADRLFGGKATAPLSPGAAAAAAAAGATAGSTQEPGKAGALTESLLSVVATRTNRAAEKGLASLFPSDTISEKMWQDLANHWDEWALPLFEPPVPGIERNIISPKSIGQDKFDAWVNERMETPRERTDRFRKAKECKIDMKGVREDVKAGSVLMDRIMAAQLSMFPPVNRPFEDFELAYFYDQPIFYFRDRISDPLHRLGLDSAYGNYALAAGEMSTWKERIQVMDSMLRKKGEIWEQTGYSSEDAVDWVVACNEESKAIPRQFRYVEDIDLIIARSLKGWHYTPELTRIQLHSERDEAAELSREEWDEMVNEANIGAHDPSPEDLEILPYDEDEDYVTEDEPMDPAILSPNQNRQSAGLGFDMA